MSGEGREGGYHIITHSSTQRYVIRCRRLLVQLAEKKNNKRRRMVRWFVGILYDDERRETRDNVDY